MRRDGDQNEELGMFEGESPENPAPLPPDHDAGSMHIPGHVIDRFFDRELTRREASGLFDAFRADPSAARRFVQTQRMLDALREPVRSPDLSRSILAKVDNQTPMLTRRGVRHVRWSRYAATAALVAIIAGAFITQRFSPQIVEVGGAEPRPLASLHATVSLDAADAVNTIQQTAEAIEFTASRAVNPRAGASAQTAAAPQPAHAFQTVRFVRARMLPEVLFPWREHSAAPDTGRVAWVVPCGTAPGAPAGSGVAADGERWPCGSSIILIDIKNASADLPRTPQGRASFAK
ncbi:MAG: hypothetical protein ACKVZJ_13420 [Phycisphaerales bacterium]